MILALTVVGFAAAFFVVGLALAVATFAAALATGFGVTFLVVSLLALVVAPPFAAGAFAAALGVAFLVVVAFGAGPPFLVVVDFAAFPCVAFADALVVVAFAGFAVVAFFVVVFTVVAFLVVVFLVVVVVGSVVVVSSIVVSTAGVSDTGTSVGANPSVEAVSSGGAAVSCNVDPASEGGIFLSKINDFRRFLGKSVLTVLNLMAILSVGFFTKKML
uniref:Uncharacterized protein n=1 Tax=Romanomermis culicivorax TaxID=13658 RepID=A0A915JZT5_ROMCU